MNDTQPTIHPTALLCQARNGRDREPVYTVFWQDERGREHHRAVERAEFNQLLAAAGEPSYTEPGYWQYEVAS